MSLCILTNSAALFSPAAASSGRLIRVMPLVADGQNILELPVEDDFSRIYNELESEFKEILVLTASEALLPSAEIALAAAQSHGGISRISILNTLQIGPGVGILAQIAARRAAAGSCMADVEEYIRSLIPYMFTLICPDRIPRYDNGKTPQANDAAGNLPMYSLEEGQLAIYKKVRSQRHLLEILQEFLGEFEKPQHLAYFHGRTASLHTRPLREETGSLFPGIHFHEIELNPALTTLFGDHTTGITVLEIPGEHGMLPI